ncbi:hypothetical protein [Caulobacter sp. CCH9-E1]|jgi:hypothetical protein|uniref:hypothetical protein n=1 Tax=Caulobacter sp. CCH9-E1 TaxID=1768768 RepID=UPI0008297562|nr:hypothetical protein [Caulobacter sp. CCH9-E1]
MTDDADAAFGPRAVPSPEQDLDPPALSDDERRTLRQLERRTRNGQLEAVNIRDAQQLAKLGLARHGRGGWLPTHEGLAYLKEQPDGSTSDRDATLSRLTPDACRAPRNPQET